MKKRVKADVQMVREYLNVIILSLGILILQLYHLLHKLMLIIFSHKIVFLSQQLKKVYHLK